LLTRRTQSMMTEYSDCLTSLDAESASDVDRNSNQRFPWLIEAFSKLLFSGSKTKAKNAHASKLNSAQHVLTRLALPRHAWSYKGSVSRNECSNTSEQNIKEANASSIRSLRCLSVHHCQRIQSTECHHMQGLLACSRYAKHH
jgi:hypothetical protein